MVSHDGKLVDYGENNEMAEGKPNGNPLSSLGNDLKNLTSANHFWIGLYTSVVLSVIFIMLKKWGWLTKYENEAQVAQLQNMKMKQSPFP